MSKIKLLLLGLMLWLGGCATPQYQTDYRLTPPAAAQGLVCLKRCEVAAQQCRNQCSTKNTQCAANAARQAKLELPQRLAEWEGAMALWEADVARYERDRRFWDIQISHQYRFGNLGRHCAGRCPRAI